LRTIQNNEVKVMEGARMAGKAADTEVASAGGQPSAGNRSVTLSGNRLESRELFVGTKEITIGHEGEVLRD
jgi:hemin uptake protein HemP